MNVREAIADIASTEDLLERALKLSGLVTTLFADVGFNLVVVGGSAVEFYTEGGYRNFGVCPLDFPLSVHPPQIVNHIP
jgi:hypothetical protein